MEHRYNRINIFDKTGKMIFSINTEIDTTDLAISIMKILKDRDE